jgi:hypothetical protein
MVMIGSREIGGLVKRAPGTPVRIPQKGQS